MSRAVVEALAGCDTVAVAELGARLDNVAPNSARRAVLDLARHHVVDDPIVAR